MAVVYSSLMISLLAYIRLVTTPGSSRKNTNMILPSTVISDTKTIHPTSTMPNMTSYISSSSAHLEETRSNVAENSADFLAKLQNIEESMLQHQTPSLNSSVPKASFASKRRTAPLFWGRDRMPLEYASRRNEHPSSHMIYEIKFAKKTWTSDFMWTVVHLRCAQLILLA
jgi:hypothetical protein